MPGPGPLGPRAATVRPTADTDTYGVQTYFQDCSAAGASDGTVPTASWFNHIQGQFTYAAAQAGVTVTNDQSATQDDILWKILQSVAGGTTITWSL